MTAAGVAPGSLSSLPARRFWGWGWQHETLTAPEAQAIHALVGLLGGTTAHAAREPRVDDFVLPPPRVAAPAALAPLLSGSAYDRLTHSAGKSCADGLRMWLREPPYAPDWVVYPRREADVVDLLDWASNHDIAVVPFGGGTSVVGGVEPAVGDGYAATLSLDLEYLNRVLEVDPTSRSALIEGSVYGPALEDALRPHGLTLRHFPQSFVFSTLGGWIATRSGGHYATLATHIDDFVQGLRLVTPAGIVETRRLPGSGAGPAPERLLIGSEGTLGIVTRAWMRLQQRPRFRASASLAFDDLPQAVAGVRALAQSGLHPSNCRLLDADEVALNRIGDGRSPMLVIGFESADHPLRPWLARALQLAGDHGGRIDAEAAERALRASDAATTDRPARSTGSSGDGGAEGRAASVRAVASDDPDPAAAWRAAFLRMPYWRDEATRMGVLLDTFESAVTWDRFDAFYAGVKRDVDDAIRRATGHEGLVSCRFTHVYPDGPAPYFTFAALGSARGDLRSALAAWRDIKAACSAAVIAHGGTITHHHAVGRDHRGGYEVEVDSLWREAFRAAKHAFDPRGVMNPGVLVDPQGRHVGITGATAAR